jgi:hypothetical protein
VGRRARDVPADLADTVFVDLLPADRTPAKYENVEHINYIIVLIGELELAGVPMILSFFRGSYMRGSNFATLLKLRKAPIFGCQFEAWTQFETNPKGDWYGIQVSNPSIDNEAGIGPFCDDEARYEQLKAVHLELKEAHAKGILQADYEDVEEAKVIAANDATKEGAG